MDPIRTQIDGKAVKDFYGKNQLFFLVTSIFGLGCITYYIATSAIQNKWVDVLGIILVILGALVFILSVFQFVVIRFNIANTEKNKIETETVFRVESIHIKSYRGDKLIGEKDVPYSELTCFYIRNENIFIQIGKNFPIPVKKTDRLSDFLIDKNVPLKK